MGKIVSNFFISPDGVVGLDRGTFPISTTKSRLPYRMAIRVALSGRSSNHEFRMDLQAFYRGDRWETVFRSLGHECEDPPDMKDLLRPCCLPSWMPRRTGPASSSKRHVNSRRYCAGPHGAFSELGHLVPSRDGDLNDASR